MSCEVMEHDAMSCDMTYMLYHMMTMSGDDMSCDMLFMAVQVAGARRGGGRGGTESA